MSKELVNFSCKYYLDSISRVTFLCTRDPLVRDNFSDHLKNITRNKILIIRVIIFSLVTLFYLLHLSGDKTRACPHVRSRFLVSSLTRHNPSMHEN